jgi:lysophospholipid acyltransferase (LPLAT)-like uncharacterized protein
VAIKNLLLSTLIYWLFRALSSTWKIIEDKFPPEIQKRLDQGELVVFAHLHEDEWALLGAYANRNMTSLVSLSKDGELMSMFLGKLGFDIHRGSSSRGGASGFISILRSLRKRGGGKLSFAVDGPRGPRRRAKKGIFKAAQLLNAPILPAAVYVNRLWPFKKAWSKGFLPKPFATIRICYTPSLAPENIDLHVKRDDYAVLCETLESKLLDAKRLAEKKIRGDVLELQ